MRRLVPALVAVAVVIATVPLAAQSRPPLTNRNPRPAAFTLSTGYAASWGELDDHVNFTQRGPLVGGADGGPHVALGAAFPVRSTALELRVEAFYNHLRGPRNTTLGTDHVGNARMASRDQVFAAGTVLLWRARPAHRFGPYLMTGAGAYHTMLTSAPTSDDPSVLRASGTAYGISFGAGLEAPIFRRRYFVELRRHLLAANAVRGAAFLPLTVGTRF